MTTTAHGMVGLVLRFTPINAVQIPCGANAIAIATSAVRASAKIRFRGISDRPRLEPGRCVRGDKRSDRSPSGGRTGIRNEWSRRGNPAEQYAQIARSGYPGVSRRQRLEGSPRSYR